MRTISPSSIGKQVNGKMSMKNMYAGYYLVLLMQSNIEKNISNI